MAAVRTRFRILSLSVGIQIILSSSGSIFQAAGDTKSLFVCGLFSSALNVAGMLLGIFHFGTLTAVAGCIVVTFTVNFAQCYWQMYRVTFRRSVLPFVRQLLSPLAVSLLMAAILLRTVRDGRNKYFSYNNRKKYSKFYYLWGIYTSYA